MTLQNVQKINGTADKTRLVDIMCKQGLTLEPLDLGRNIFCLCLLLPISSKNVHLYQMLCFLITLITFNQDLNAQYNFKTLKPTI